MQINLIQDVQKQVIDILNSEDSPQARLNLVLVFCAIARQTILSGVPYNTPKTINFTSILHVCADDWSLIVNDARRFFDEIKFFE